MKFCAVAIVLTFLAPALLRAQTNAAPANAAAAAERQAFSILTPAQLKEYADARVKALADDADLNSENNALKEEFADVMANGDAAQKQALLVKVDAHRQKLRAAMLKEDPNLSPIFAQIDKSISDMKAKSAPPQSR